MSLLFYLSLYVYTLGRCLKHKLTYLTWTIKLRLPGFWTPSWTGPYSLAWWRPPRLWICCVQLGPCHPLRELSQREKLDQQLGGRRALEKWVKVSWVVVCTARCKTTFQLLQETHTRCTKHHCCCFRHQILSEGQSNSPRCFSNIVVSLTRPHCLASDELLDK